MVEGSNRRRSAAPSPDSRSLGDLLERLPPELQTPDPKSPRGRILVSARILFSEHGFDRTSTRVIAETARVNQAMIHYYFGTKEALYRRVIALEILAVFRSISVRLKGRRKPEDVLLRFPVELMKELREHPRRCWLIRREIGQGGEHARQAILAMREFGPKGFRDVFASMLTQGQREGRLRDLPPEAVLPFLLSVAYGSAMMEPLFQMVLGQSAEDQKVWSERLRVFSSLIRDGLLTKEAEA